MSQLLRRASKWSVVISLAMMLILRIDALSAIGWHNLGTMALLDALTSNVGQPRGPSESLVLAKELLDNALTSHPMAHTYRNLGIVSTLLGQTTNAVQELRAAVQLNDRDEMNYLALGHAYQAAGVWKTVVGTHFEDGYQLESTPSAIVGSLLVLKADGYRENGRLSEAFEWYNWALGIHPSLAPAYIGLSHVYVAEGKYAEALYTYRKALIFGGCCLKTSVYEEYYRILAQAVENTAQSDLVGHSSTDYLLGEAYWKGGRSDLAIAALERALSSPEKLEARQRARAHFILGFENERADNLEKAVSHYEKAIDLDMRRVDAHLRLYHLYKRLGRTDRAVRIAERLGALQPAGDVDDLRSGARLLGYDVDEAEIALGPLFSMTLYWQLPDDVTPSGTDWFRSSGRWIQIVTARNLVPNGSFEWLDSQGRGLGVGDYDARTRPYAIVETPRLELETHALLLRPANPAGPSGVQTPPISLRRGKKYLLGVWHHGYGGEQMRLGCLWADHSGKNREAYYGSGRLSESWDAVGEILQLSGDSPFDACSVRLLNPEPRHDLLFDNLILVELPLPGESKPGDEVQYLGSGTPDRRVEY